MTIYVPIYRDRDYIVYSPYKVTIGKSRIFVLFAKVQNNY